MTRNEFIKSAALYAAVFALASLWGALLFVATKPKDLGTRYYVIAADKNAPVDPTRPTGALGVRPVKYPQAGLDEDEIRLTEALQGLVSVLGEGKNVEEILSGCNRYAPTIFAGTSDSEKSGEPAFFGLKIMEKFSRAPYWHGGKRRNVPGTKDVFLFSDSGYVCVRVTNYLDKDRGRKRKSLGSSFDPIPESLPDLLNRRGGEVHCVDVVNYAEKTLFTTVFRGSGVPINIAWLTCEFDSESIETTKARRPTITHAAFVRHTIGWNEDGQVEYSRPSSTPDVDSRYVDPNLYKESSRSIRARGI